MHRQAMEEFAVEHLEKIVFRFHFFRFTLAKTEIIYPKNVGALVAMNFT